MAEFNMKFTDVENSVEVLSHYAVQLNQIKEELSAARGILRREAGVSWYIEGTLLHIERSVMDEALGMRSLSGALEKISAYYRNTERKILSAGDKNIAKEKTEDSSGGNSAPGRTIGQMFRDLLVTLGIVRAEKQTRTEGEAVHIAQEREMNRYLQNEISKILRKKEYSKKTWNQASVEEKKVILNKYLQEVAGVMGLEVGEIVFTYSGVSDGTYNKGAYSSDINTVSINEWVLENGGKDNIEDSYCLLNTIVHEMRHAYQWNVCENPEQFVVTEETIQKWQNSMDTYKSQSGFMAEGMNEDDAYEAYRRQDVEVDARWFAKQD